MPEMLKEDDGGMMILILYVLGPAKTYILRGTARTYAIKTRVVTDN